MSSAAATSAACCGAGAAERDQRALARVDPLAHRDLADRLGHVRADDRVHAASRLLRRHAEPGRKLLERRLRRRGVERHVAPEQTLRADQPEQQVGVGDRRQLAAAPVAGRARHRPGAARPDLEAAAAVEPADAAAAGADRLHVEREGARRDAPAQLDLRAEAELVVPDQRDVRARAAHVHRDRVAAAEPPGDGPSGQHAGRRPGERELDRPRACLVGRERAGSRLHVVDGPRHGAGEIVDVDAHARHRHRVQDGGREALVLADPPVDVGRERHGQVGGDPGDDGRDALLVHRVGVRVVERDRDRLDAELDELAHGRSRPRPRRAARPRGRPCRSAPPPRGAAGAPRSAGSCRTRCRCSAAGRTAGSRAGRGSRAS